MKTELRRLFLGLLVFLSLAMPGWSYVYSSHQSVWKPGPIPMEIKLGSGTTLSDGTNHSTSVQAAMQTWNGHLGTVQFSPLIVSPGGQVDFVNDIYFDSTIEGAAFGEDVLAVTLTYTSSSVYEITETDIIFNTAWSWDSYRGNHLPDTEDIRRVALHELGHVLGLSHPDENGQPGISAQMNSTVSNLDGLTADDTAGAQSLYRAPGQTAPPLNDQLANAIAISLASGSTQVLGTSLYATAQAGEPLHDPSDEFSGASVWWKWTASTNGNITVTTQGSKFDTLLGVYTGSAVNALVLVGRNDDVDSGDIRYSSVAFFATAGTTYYFAVDGWAGASGPIVVNLNFVSTAVNSAPTASFTLSSERTIGQTISVNLNVNDVNGNLSFANLWVHTPNRGWLTIRANNSVVVSGDLSASNNSITGAGAQTRTFTFTATDGAGTYRFLLQAADSSGAVSAVASQTITVVVGANAAPTASFTLSSERTIGQTISVNLNVNDADGNLSFANLWVNTPGRGWLTIRANNSVVVSGDLSASNNSITGAGAQTRTFAFTATDGPGDYRFMMQAADTAGALSTIASQTITVANVVQAAPTASFTLSAERNLGESVSISLNVGDANNNLSFANLWVQTPNRGWLTIKADNSVVVSGDLTAANNSITGAGAQTRTFAFTGTDGPGAYRFVLQAVDATGLLSPAASQTITVVQPVPPSFSLPLTQSDLSIVAGINHLPVRIPITLDSGVDAGTLTASSNVAWMSAAVDAARSELVLTLAAQGLTNATNAATVTVSRPGESVVTLAVRGLVAPANIIALMDDPARSRTYGLHQNGIGPGAVVVFEPISGTYLGTITVGSKPADMAISADAQEMLVINGASRTISAIDLTRSAVGETIPLVAFEQWSGPAETSAHIQYGPGGIIYYSDGSWAPILRVFDRNTRTVSQTLTASADSYGFGDFVVTPDRTALVAWGQYGWSAGSAASGVAKFAIAENGTLTRTQTALNLNYPQFGRDPLDTPALVTASGLDVFIKQLRFTTSSIINATGAFPTPVYSISAQGEIAATAAGIFEVATGNKLYTITPERPVQAITSDYARLVYFNTTSRQLQTINLIEAIGTSILGRNLSPSDGAVVLAPAELRWTPQPGIDRHRVYLGTSAAAVNDATTASSEYLGEVTGSVFTLATPLAPGFTYYWRVDSVGTAEVGKGPVFSFTVATIAASQPAIDTSTVRGHAAHVVTIDLSSAVSGKTWTASATESWISFAGATGTTPATLQVRLNASTLAAGVHQGAVTITADDGAFIIPVKLRIDPLALTVIKSVPGSTKAYAISEQDAALYSGYSRAYLLEIDTLFKRIERVAAVGTGVTDLAVHEADGRIYVPNWRNGSLLAINRTTFALDRTYAFPPFGGVGYSSGDVYRVSAGGPGRLVVEAQDQWVRMSIYDTVAGQVLSSANVGAGGGQYAPDKRHYFHGDSNSSGAQIHKYDTAGDVFLEMAQARVSTFSYYGSRTVVVSEDGQSVFWNGGVFDENLALDWDIGANINCVSADGRFAFGDSKVYDVATRQIFGNLPATTSVSAFNSVTGRLVYQAGVEVAFYELPNSDLPGRTRVPADGSIVSPLQTLQWTAMAGATAYRIYLGTTQAAVQAAIPSSPEYLGQVTSSSITLPSALGAGLTYYWRVDIVVGAEVAPGNVQAFFVSTLVPSLTAINAATVKGHTSYDVPVQITAPAAGTAWSAATNVSWIRLDQASGVCPATVRVTLDTTTLPLGQSHGTVTFTSAGVNATIPVSLTVDPLAVTILKTDPASSKAYAISEENAGAHTGTSRAYLLEIDAQTESILRVARVGTSVTDLALHAAENRIYIPNWKDGKLLALDRDTFAQARAYQFKPRGNSGSPDGDVFRVAAGASGRVMVEQNDQWVYITLFDTATGARIGSQHVREGGGQYDPSRRYYYHGENNSSGAEIRRYDMAGDVFTALAHVRPGSNSANYYGSRTVVVAGDGSRILWGDNIYDDSLSLIWTASEQLHSSTPDGRYAFGVTKIFDVVQQRAAFSMPSHTAVSAFNAAAGKLIVQNGARLGFYSFNAVTGFPAAPVIVSQPVAASVTTSNVAVFTVGATGAATLAYQWQVSPPGSSTWTNLNNSGGTYSGVTTPVLTVNNQTAALNGYSYRVVVSNGSGTATSAAALLSVATINRPPTATFSLSSQRTVGQSVTVSLSLGDLDGNYHFANLWVHTPGRGWLTVKANNSVVVSGDLNPANTVAFGTGNHNRTFTFTPADGAGEYRFLLQAADLTGAVSAVASETITVAAPVNAVPTAAFTLGSQRTIGQTISINLNVNDSDGNLSFANLWVNTPGRGWLTIRANNSVVVSGDLSAANNSITGSGAQTRTFTFTPTDGAGAYRFVLQAADASGALSTIASQTITVVTPANAAPTASFTLGSQRTIGQTIPVSLNVNDADGNLSFANLWVRTPNRGWLTIRANNAVVVSGDLSAANNSIITAGTHNLNFEFTAVDGPGEYRFVLQAADMSGALSPVASETITVAAGANAPPTASFTLSSERTMDQTISVILNVGDANGNLSFANLWVHTPGRGWLTIRANNSVVVSGDLTAANNSITAPGFQTRTFTFTPVDGVGDYRFVLQAADAAGALSTVASQTIAVVSAVVNQPPAVSFALSSERVVGQTLIINGAITDAENNYRFANLWVRTPNRGWLTIRADNSVVVSGDLNNTNTVAATAGSFARAFALTAVDGPGQYTFVMTAVDTAGLSTTTAPQTITVTSINTAPTASFTLSAERAIGQTISVNLNVNDADGNLAYANLWVNTPGRGWLTVRANNSVVQSGELSSANTSITGAGAQTRTFSFTANDGAGDYRFLLQAADTSGALSAVASQTVTVVAGGNTAPTASFTLSPERTIGQTISVNLNVGDVDGNYAFADLWVHTPGRGWLTIKADNSVVVSGDLSSANSVAMTAGAHTRTFTLTTADGTGNYRFLLQAADSVGALSAVASQTITVVAGGNTAPTASFTLSSQRTIGQTVSVNLNVTDPDGNLAYANLWVHTPGRGWLTIKADNSVVVSGDLTSANNSINGAGAQVRTFAFTATDGAGDYRFLLQAADTSGALSAVASQTITVASVSGMQAAGLSVPTSFEAWRRLKFTAAELADSTISGPDAVYGTDGLTNLLKYALGLEPKEDEFGALGDTFADETGWTFVYARPANRPDVNCVVEFSADGAHWTRAVTHELVSTSGGWELWQATYPRTGEPGSFRIMVQRR